MDAKQAKKYRDAGLSVLPVKLDKRPLISWDKLKENAPTDSEVESWGNFPGIAVVCGKVSGNLTCLDFDLKHDPLKTIAKEFSDLLKEWGMGDLLRRFVIETTPSKGFHFLFRSPVNNPGEKLTRHVKGGEAIIETRGEGNYFVCAPTPGWELKQGTIETIPTFTSDEANIILNACWALDRVETPQADPIQAPRDLPEGKSTFEDYNDKATFEDVEDLLLSRGWKRGHQHGENVHYTRPGKNDRSTAATLHKSRRTFYVFSSSSEFPSGKAQSPVGVYAMLTHGGDFKAAAKDLRAKGFGEKQKPYSAPRQEKKAEGIFSASIQKGVRIVTPEEMRGDLYSAYDKPYYPGESTGWKEIDNLLKIEKGQLNVITGIPSHGKSSFMDALMMNLSIRSKWKCAVFSPENKTSGYHTSKLAEIFTGKPFYGPGRMTREEMAEAYDYISKTVTFLMSHMGGASLDDVLEAVNQIAPDIAVIDPWNRLDHSRQGGMTETEYIGQSLSRVSYMAQTLNISFWIVAHPQKLRRDRDGELSRPGFYDISGSANWANMADNGLLVFRNGDGDTEIETLKVRFRHNGTAGMAKLRFNRPSGRFSSLDFTDGMDSRLPKGDR